jgi:hypothetical protein
VDVRRHPAEGARLPRAGDDPSKMLKRLVK